jgi:hypothetical protein
MSKSPRVAKPPPIPHEEPSPQELAAVSEPSGGRPPTVTVVAGEGAVVPAVVAAAAVTW